MDRMIVYPGSVPLDSDLLSTNRNTMIALGALAAATVGSGPVIDGLVVQPALSGGLAVDVNPGSVVVYSSLDQSAYGSLAADVTDNLVKIGINVARTTLPLAAPLTAGLAVSYLIQAAFQELDVAPVVLPYYNSANPSQPFLGAGNNGLPQPTVRTQRVALLAKAGAAAAVGASVPPAPDPGWLGLAVVTIANGKTSVLTGDIGVFAPTRSVAFKLPDLRPGASSWAVFPASGTFVVPPNVTRVKVTVVGGGGAGGLHATLPSGGGGGGGLARGWIYNLVPGGSVPVQVGGGGAPATSPGNGGTGGTSSFGPYVSATGGQGGYGGIANVVMAGGLGGVCYGGDVRCGGSGGSDAIPLAARGGDGGGPGAGRGTSGLVQGVAGAAPGAGGGGGGSSAPSGLGFGANGGPGAAGIVLVEY